MTFKNELEAGVRDIFTEIWQEVATSTVPDPEDLRLTNHAKHLEWATVLYADLNGSTNMVDSYSWQFSAEIYKAYLRCAATLVKKNDGVITAYDGDRIMAIFTGGRKNTSAARTAFAINWAVEKVIRPQIAQLYSQKKFTLNHSIGIDTSPIRAARIGVRGYNDLVWVGSAANHAAKLTNLAGGPIWITKAVYEIMLNEVKIASTGVNMWEKRLWTAMNSSEVYRSNWIWGYD